MGTWTEGPAHWQVRAHARRGNPWPVDRPVRPKAIRAYPVEDRCTFVGDRQFFDWASVRAAVEAAGPVDVLINNAAWGAIGPIETIPLGEVRAMYETNVFGVIRMLQAVLPGMRERGRGTVVNISSLAGVMATMPLNGLYASTKHALEALTETLHYELRHFGLRVVAVEPAYTATSWSGNERWLGVDQPPWDELYAMVRALDEQGIDGAAPAEEVVAVIVEAIESDNPPLRMPVGEDARETIEMRRKLDDRKWEELVDEHRPFSW